MEGDRNARVRLWSAPWTARKIRLRAAKWSPWFLIALATGAPWVFYLTDAPTLLGQLIRFEAAPAAYASIAILTATTFVLGGLLREQVCVYMCPWPRIQAAMMDEDTITVGYRAASREASTRPGPPRACVNVCPMGDRHSRGPAARPRHLRALHRRLRRGDGKARQAARVDRLLLPGRGSRSPRCCGRGSGSGSCTRSSREPICRFR